MTKKFIPVVIKNNMSDVIGSIEFTEDGLKKINKNSVFSIAYVPKENGEVDLLYISMDTDSDYKKYLLTLTDEEMANKIADGCVKILKR